MKLKKENRHSIHSWYQGRYTETDGNRYKVLLVASVASMIDQFNMSNIRLLQEMGAEVHVACNFRQGNTCSRSRIIKLLRRLRDMQVVYHSWDCPRNIHALAECARAYVQMCRLLRQYSFAWMHCQSPIGGVLARLAAHRQKLPVIYTVHGFHFYKGAPLRNWLLYYPVEKLLSYWTDLLVTVNREDDQFARQNLMSGKVCRIPGIGIDTKRFDVHTMKKDVREKEGWFCQAYQIPKHALVLLSVGELNTGKNHRIVIQALAALRRKDVYYMICGQGVQQDSLMQEAAALGVGEYIRMPGYQEDMPRIYCNADIFVFPSIREGMPVSLMEAMAASLPCVVSDIRGNRELIGTLSENGGRRKQQMTCFQRTAGGAVFDLEYPCQLAAALKLLLQEQQMRIECGAYNRRKICQFSQEAVEQQMRRIYTWMFRFC